MELRIPKCACLGPALIVLLLLGACAGNLGVSPRSTERRGAAVAPAQTVTSTHGVVVAGHPEAAEIGVEVLAAGGNAMDAAVAVSLALAVAEPYGSGLGGKLMLLYYEASSDRVYAVDAMDQAGSAFDPDRFAALDQEERVVGWGAVAIPGLVAGMHEGHRRWGHLPWRDVVLPAAQLAQQGSLVLPGTVELFERRIDRIRAGEETQKIYLPNDRLPIVGQRLTNKDLSRTLTTVAEHGAAGFYRGWVAEAIVEEARRHGGSLSLEDLDGYRPRVVEPLRIEMGNFEVVSAPPPASGGATVLLTLAGLADADWSGHSILEADNLNLLGRRLQEVYPVVQSKIADHPGAFEAFEGLKASPMKEGRGAAETADEAAGETLEGVDEPTVESTSTTHFVVIDEAGNMASVTQSLSHHFGAGVVAPGTGVLFNNSLKNFTFEELESVNLAAPGKRPRSTIAPTFVFENGNPRIALGLPGGQRIPTATLQVLLDVLIFDVDLATAVAKPRLHLVRPPDSPETADLFELEQFVDPSLGAALRDRGWQVRVNEDSEAFGGFCAAELGADGSRIGIADSRRTNAARSWPGNPP